MPWSTSDVPPRLSHNRLTNEQGATMSKVRVHNFAISLDGYAAGPDQSIDNPLGVGGEALHTWAFATRTFQLVSSPSVVHMR
jgi:hypothetical protein